MTEIEKKALAEQLSAEASRLVDELMGMAARRTSHTKRLPKWVELCETAAEFCRLVEDPVAAREFEAMAHLVARLKDRIDFAFAWRRFWINWNALYEDESSVFYSPLLA